MEPKLKGELIQGNVAPGFRMPYQRVVALDAPGTAAGVVASLLPRVTTMATAVPYTAAASP